MKLSASDALVSALSFAGSCALLWLFALDIGTVSFRANEKPLGTVVFKKMTATRRPSDALGWERMRNDSPVYNADTLRTGTLSEAAIFFDDGTSLELDANSMLKLDFGGPTRNLEFLDGEITVGGSAAGSDYVISSKAGTISVGADSSATFSRDETNNVIGVEVNKGTARLTRADGSTQEVKENQAIEVNAADGSSRFVSRPIIPLKPARNARILGAAGSATFAGGARVESGARVEAGQQAGAQLFEFVWQLEAGGAGSSAADSGALPAFTLEISAEKDFSAIAATHQAEGLSAFLPVLPGTWFWRVRDEAGRFSPARKFSYELDSFPRPAFPEDGAEYRYRKRLPEIRFAWTAMKEASAYVFELSDSPAFTKSKIRTRVSGSNISLSEIGAGLWYWRVTPVHGYTETLNAPEPVARTLRIEKSGAMQPIASSTPFNGLLYQIQEIDEKGLAFAWLPHAEAVSYELVVSEAESFSDASFTVSSLTPYIRLSGDAAAVLRKPGTRYWAVRWIDNEGNASPVSEPRRIIGIDGSIALRPVFPPEGYRIADSLVSNIRFTWKSNIAADTFFVLSDDPSFSTVFLQEKAAAETLFGRAWKSGTWYWKIRTLNADGSVFIETPVRSFTILDPLPGTAVTKPAVSSLLYLREGDSAVIEWNPVPGADYCNLALYSPEDGYAEPVFERTHLTENALEIPMGNFRSGRYAVRIQGFASESEESTRIIGYIGESFLSYRRLEYLKLASPEDGAVFEGLEALRRGVELRYETANPPEAQEFTLTRIEGRSETEAARSSSKGELFTARRLVPGSYLWTVGGTLAGFDISAQETRLFTVLPVPPLPAPVVSAPAAGAVFGVQEFRNSRTIDFAWSPVEGSNQYTLSIYPEGKRESSFTKSGITETRFTLSDLTALSRGKNRVRVEASWTAEDGVVEQPGLPGETSFTVDLPPARQAASRTGGSLYGR